MDSRLGRVVTGLTGLAVIGAALQALLLSGCARQPVSRRATSRPPGGEVAAPRPQSFRSPGERIYFTGVDEDGRKIGFSGGPSWLTTEGGSCVDCHGADGKGGKPVLMGTAVPPDIRYRTLTSPEHEHEGHEEHEHGEATGHEQHEEHEEHPPYADALIKRAIKDGLDPAGGELDLTMPRWRMSHQQLDDVVAFLKELDGRSAGQE